MSPNQSRPYDPISISPLAFWAATPDAREQAFRVLREERPLSWHPPIEGALQIPRQPGVWAVVRHEDIVRVSKDTATFSSAQGVLQEEAPPELLDAAQSILGMDAPRHMRLRKLVSSAFSPRQLALIEAQIAAEAERIVDELLETGDCDFVAHVSKRLPNWTIYEMMGLPVSQRARAAEAAEGMVSWADAQVAAGRAPAQVMMDSLQTLLSLGSELADARRRKPADDLMTRLVEAEVDGERLTDHEISAFFVLLSVAGNDTTRSTISVAAKALSDFPAQRALLLQDFERHIKTAVEEFVRWATPVMTFRRTVTVDTELHGQTLRAGEWVVLCFASGNRDERVFREPERFDITRSPNPHLGFGGGPHFCLGNMLAKVQLRAIFEQLLRRVPKLALGEPTYLVSNFVHGIKSMPCSLG